MGITGLIPFLKNASRPANIKDYKGCTVAVDSYCWLHRGAFACADKLARGEKTEQYVYYCMKYVNSLLSFGVKPVMVFDGCRLPSKADEEKKRRERRTANRKKAAQLLREGKNSEARKYLATCVDITPAMALELMNACRAKGVDCIVAPYEADAQLAYLSSTGIAQVIITEDSDLILFGCERVMFKMDFAGNGLLVERQDLNKAMELRPENYTFEKFRIMCILSGCDYLPSLPGIGLGKAKKYLKLTRQDDLTQLVKKLPNTLGMNNLSVPQEYIDGFIQANNTFLYQLVYDPMRRKLVPLTPYPDGVQKEDLLYAGEYMSSEKAFNIAQGNIDVNTGVKLNNYNPDIQVKQLQEKKESHMKSIWDREYKPIGNVRNSRNTEQNHLKKPSTLGKEVTVKYPKRQRTVELNIDDSSLTDSDLLKAYETEMMDVTAPVSKKAKLTAEDEPNNLNPIDAQVSSLEPIGSLDAGPSQSSVVEEIYEQMDSASSKKPSGLEVNPVDTLAEQEVKPKNKFALRNKSPRERFNLNVKKGEVKSRFFAPAEPLKKTSFFMNLEKKHRHAELPSKYQAESDEESDDSDDVKTSQQPSASTNILNIEPPSSLRDLDSTCDSNQEISKLDDGSTDSMGDTGPVYHSVFSSKRNSLKSKPQSNSRLRTIDSFRSKFDKSSKIANIGEKSDNEIHPVLKDVTNTADSGDYSEGNLSNHELECNPAKLSISPEQKETRNQLISPTCGNSRKQLISPKQGSSLKQMSIQMFRKSKIEFYGVKSKDEINLENSSETVKEVKHTIEPQMIISGSPRSKKSDADDQNTQPGSYCESSDILSRTTLHPSPKTSSYFQRASVTSSPFQRSLLYKHSQESPQSSGSRWTSQKSDQDTILDLTASDDDEPGENLAEDAKVSKEVLKKTKLTGTKSCRPSGLPKSTSRNMKITGKNISITKFFSKQ